MSAGYLCIARQTAGIITNLNTEDQREHEGSTSIKFTMFPRKTVSFELLNRPYLMDEQLHPNTTH